MIEYVCKWLVKFCLHLIYLIIVRTGHKLSDVSTKQKISSRRTDCIKQESSDFLLLMLVKS